MRSKQNLRPKLPALEDPAWEALSQPVLDFLNVPRNWQELNEWARACSYNGTQMRHAVAWLEHQEVITSFLKKELNSRGRLRKKLYWVSMAWVNPGSNVS